jgi:ABC-type taurine transport system ATPase subunit
MLTRLQIKNFKRFPNAEIELGQAVVFIGPNNSGKTTALQALALWDVGLRKWNATYKDREAPSKRPGVTINRRDLVAIPVPGANLLWHNLHVRDVSRANGKQDTRNIRVEIQVEGLNAGRTWTCGLEFDYANEESFYCRPLRLEDEASPRRMPIPEEAAAIRVAFLPPMSGLAATEPKWEPGRINVLLGEGQTAQVLRNLCNQLYEQPEPGKNWQQICGHIKALFGVELQAPEFIRERGEITMSYREPAGCELDLSSAGRGLQQTLLLLAHLYANPRTVLLLDEPDAHLEVLRQRQIYQLLTTVAARQESQIIAASHSEIVLNEAAGRDLVVAFVGRPHRIDARASQVLKALVDIGFDQYYQAEVKGWVLYLEGATDLAILQTFARTLEHPAAAVLQLPFVHYMSTNLPNRAREHFFGLCEAKRDLVGLALFDRIDNPLRTDTALMELMWQRREIENYLCQEDVLLAYARHDQADDLFGRAEAARRETVMRECIRETANALRIIRRLDPWSNDVKASDDFLDPLFDLYFKTLGLPNLLRKSDYYILAGFVPKMEISPEVAAKLDAILQVVTKAKPRGV